MSSNDSYFDSLEIRTPAERQQQMEIDLPAQIQHAKDCTPAYNALFESVDATSITSLDALSSLPVTRKSELSEAQNRVKPFGGFACGDAGTMLKVFASPGPLYEPECETEDYWRIARAMYAAGIRRGDLVHNTYSYHFTPAGSMMETAARKLGAAVFPAGVGQTELQVGAILDLEPNSYAGTPSFLKILLEKADEAGTPITCFQKALVSGEALPPSLRTRFTDVGIQVLQAYATADLGLIAYESTAMQGLIVDEGAIVEIVRPGTGEPVPEGEVGEVVVTTFNKTYPLVRFATGDLSAVLSGESPCGRTNLRIKGWMGRADQTTKIKGMFVHPQQVDKVSKRHPEIIKSRLVVINPDNKDQLIFKCEVKQTTENLVSSIETSIRDVMKLGGQVELVSAGTLENDGKVIDDCRTYE